MKKIYKNENGITMIALLITIIVLIMLAGVTLYTLINLNIIGISSDAKVKADLKTIYEQLSEVINAKKLDGEDTSVLELKLDALDELQNKDPEIYSKIQNIDPEILEMLIISQGDIKYIEEKVRDLYIISGEGENAVYDEEKISEMLKYLEELGIEEFVAKESHTTQQLSTVIITPGKESVAGTKTKITKNITEYEYQVSFVLDLSGSMMFSIYDKGEEDYLADDNPNQRLLVAKNAISNFIDSFYNLQEKGQLQVITFNFDSSNAYQKKDKYSGTMFLKDKNGNTVLSSKSGVAENKTEAAQIKQAINDISIPQGLGTYYTEAVNKAASSLRNPNMFKSTVRTETKTEETADTITITNKTIENKKIIIFFSDGEPSQRAEKTSIVNVTNTIKASGDIDIYTIGFAIDTNVLKNMATVKDGKTLYYTATDTQSLIDTFASILESATTEQGQEAVFEETIITEPEISDVGEVNTGKNNNLLIYEIGGGKFDKTSPIEICRKEADGTYTVLASYYVNNLPQSITYDGTAVYWDLSKEKSEFIGNNIVLRFSVVQINETGFSIRSTENP